MSKQTSAHKLSETEGFAHIESYLASGLRPSEYYRKHNLSEYQFYSNIMSSHTIITTRMKLENKDILSIRQPSRANQHAAQIYNA
ncbi:MAG: hypothetical protein LBF05_00245, partial [Tannerella sp.]|nr:hypothetical protein [Tannerella sp.]